MYIANTKVHTQDRKRPVKKQTYSSVPQPAATPVKQFNGLSLPRIHSSVPSTFTIQGNVLESSLSLLSLVDAGFITADDVPEKWQANDIIVENALNRWTSTISEKLKVLDMKIIYSEMLSTLITDAEMLEEEIIKVCDADPEQDTINFGVYANSWDEVFIGKKVEELEKAVPGFGKTVMAHLNRETSSGTMYCVTPQEAIGFCSHLYWYGEEDESCVLEEMKCEMDEEELEIEKENIIKKSDFFEFIPEWSVDNESPLTIDQIKALTRSRKSFVAKVAKALLPLAENKSKESISHSVPIMHDHISPALLIRWDKKDMISRVHDDWYNYLSQGESSNDIHRFFISNQEPTQLKDMFASMEQYIEQTSQVDTLISLLMEV